ncbi:P-loop NTPase fold protein [Vreelandella boliviensis]|uniref:KAP NTPase domain-containing protein n=1 Tax=Vreelandella boliviensis LC1 TaxID=1072583 RepID=A0A265DUS7_9GAMM|nr:P-loop NTPase fold protein [Halomonas boliviensis]EHJ91174.1 hypothetical protein KUC_3617 [Halomonas boliviensis LC1]OZT73073.1 hypothetical protein CE457_16215 [Halomonas boliviensis LC1]
MNASSDYLNKKKSFQLEAPESQDLFQGKGHENAANGMLGVIRDNEDVHIIGVEGELGAGKSTVIKILERKLDSEKYKFIYFDADRYQYSSTKAAFVKVFYNKLRNIAKEGSADAIDIAKNKALGYHVEYTKRTNSSMSPYVIAFLGVTYLFLRNIKESVEITYSSFVNMGNGNASFIIEDFLTVAFSLSPLALWLAVKLRNKIKEGSEEITFGNIFKRNSDDRISEVFEVSKEVGSFELKEAFSVFSKSIPIDKTIILVIDNIDRVDPEKAKEVWSDLDIFTSISNERIKVILPYSEDHLAKSISPNVIEGKEYIAKRLPVVFRAPPIVTAGWREQFYIYWDQTLGEVKNSDKCAELIDVWRDGQSQITPRTLKKHINDICCTIKGNVADLECAVACTAYLLAVQKYNVKLNLLLTTENIKIDDKVLERKILATRRVLNSLYTVDEWTEIIACIHYQTNKDIARSELLYEPISQAISSYNAEEILSLSAIFGFDVFFQKAINSYDSREMVKLASFVLESESNKKKEWLLEWLPKINVKTKMESVPEDFDQKYVESARNLVESDYELNLRLINDGIVRAVTLIKKDDRSRDQNLQELYLYSRVEGFMPQAIVDCDAEIFVNNVWPSRSSLEDWDLNKIKFNRDKISKIVSSAVKINLEDKSFVEIFRWLMPKHYIGHIDYQDSDSPSSDLKLDIGSVGETGVFLMAYYQNLYESTTLEKIVINLKNGTLKGGLDQWTALLLLLASSGGQYNTTINHREPNKQPKKYSFKNIVDEMVVENPGYKNYMNSFLRFSRSFDDLVSSFKNSEIKSYLSPFVKDIVCDKQVFRLDINDFISSEKYGLLSGSHEDLDGDVVLLFLNGWSRFLNINLLESSKVFIDDIIESSNDVWKKRLRMAFEDRCVNSDDADGLIQNPSINEVRVVEWLSGSSYVSKSSSELRDLIEKFINNLDQEKIKSPSSLGNWLELMFSILHKNTKGALLRFLQAKFMEKTTSNLERFFIIESFPNDLMLEKAESDSAIDICIFLVDQAERESVLKWLDDQQWHLDDWSDEQVNHLVEAMQKHSDVFNFEKIKSNTVIQKKLKKEKK